MTIPAASREGTIEGPHGNTWYRVTGSLDGPRTPVVVLHGGPGAAHNYTLAMASLSSTGRAVIHYDQLGCGRSTHLPDAPSSLWTVELFLDELERLLADLGIDGAYHVIGQSWGGMLGAEHAIRQPRGLRSLVIANSPASMRTWVSEANRLRAELPAEVQSTLLRHESAGTTDDPEYAAAVDVFDARHVCRVVPNPPEVAASFAAIGDDPTVYHTMNGPSEFHVVGSLLNWDITGELGHILAPTLLISGAYDEATPMTMAPFATGIRDVSWELFRESSHMPHVEEPERFHRIVAAFLDAHD